MTTTGDFFSTKVAFISKISPNRAVPNPVFFVYGIPSGKTSFWNWGFRDAVADPSTVFLNRR
jgi:hypothetical protein